MRHQPSIFTTSMAYLIALIAFLQVWNHWGDKTALALFFLIGGIAVLLINTYEIWRYKRDYQAIEEMDCMNENGD